MMYFQPWYVDSLGYQFIGKVNNPDGTITSYGYSPSAKAFIQKVWRSSNDFTVVAIFKRKQ